MRILRFNEAKLNIEELRKRGDVLVDKLKKQVTNANDPQGFLTFTKGSTTIVGTVSNATEIINNITDGSHKTFDLESARRYLTIGNRPNYIQRFQVHSDLFKLNDIEKTVDFGRSGGSSLGSDKTKIVESIQCLYCALRQHKREKLDINDIDELFDSNNNIHPYLLDKIRIPIQLDRTIIEEFSNEWYMNFISTANALYDKKPLYADKSPNIRLRVTRNTPRSDKESTPSPPEYRVLAISKRYIFYQNSYKGGLVEKLRNTYNSFEYCKSVKIEKWNPSDMWVVQEDKLGELESEIEEIVDDKQNGIRGIDTLNGFIDKKFQNKELIGISLKKVQDLVNPNLLINKVTPRPRYRFLKVRTSGTAMNSLGLQIILEQVSTLQSECRTIAINLRTFESSRVGDISGEIIGVTARHGKISLAWINTILSKFYRDTKIQEDLVETHQELDYVSDEDLLADIESMNAVVKQLGDSTKEVDPDPNKISRRRIVSKYQALRVAKILYDMNYVDRYLGLDDFNRYSDFLCEDMMYYALAIRNDIFTCPLYIRIV